MKCFSLCAAGFSLGLAMTANAASYDVFKDGTTNLLGTFEAPAAGGLLTSALLTVKGGVFDVLGAGGLTPIFDAIVNDVDGSGAPFGAVFNSVAFITTDIASNAVLCGIGECAFSFEGASGVVPGQWYVDYVPGGGGGAALAFGYYQVAPSPVPVSASGGFLLVSGGLLASAATRRRKKPLSAHHPIGKLIVN